METASTGRRVLAFLIDSTIGAVFMIPVWLQIFYSLITEKFGAGTWGVEPRWVLLSGLMIFFYRWLFVYFLGGTLGKLLLGLRVVPAHDPQASLGLLQSFLRALADGLSLFFGQSLRALVFFRFDRTHVSDWVAETRVMQWGPRKHLPRRRVGLALLIIFFSFFNSFQGIYQMIHHIRYDEGNFIFDLRP